MTIAELIVLWIILGLLPAAIAKTRGQDFFVWWVYGIFLFPIAVFHAFFTSPQAKGVEQFITGRPSGPPASTRPPMTREEMRAGLLPPTKVNPKPR
jgi:hypothetical protein